MYLYFSFILTAVIETTFFYLAGLRARDELALVMAVNVFSNIMLNLSFLCFSYDGFLLLGEFLVLVFEYLVYGFYFAFSWRLFLLTLMANGLTFVIGLFI